MTDITSPRYAELYQHYRTYYVDYQASQGLAVDDAAADAYAREQAETALAAEQTTPGAAPVEDATTAAAAAGDAPAGDAPAADAPAADAAPVIPPAPTAAPGVVPPIAPPAAAGSAFSAPAAVAPASARKRKLPVKALVIGGVAAVAVIALGVTAAIVVPGLLRGGSDVARVQDLREEPDTVWTYSASDEDYLDSPSFYALDGDRTLIVSRFDYSDWAYDNMSSDYYSLSWYAGIDDDYEAGWAAGQDYEAAYDAWWDSYDAEYPDQADYYPAEFNGTDPYDVSWGDLDETENAGAFVGWDDARYGYDHGHSLPPKPVTPDDPSNIALIDNKGDELWTVDVADVLPDHDPASLLTVLPVDGGAKYLVAYDRPTYDSEADASSTLAVIDAGSGDVVDSLDVDGAIEDAVVLGNTIVLASREDAEAKIELRPYSVTSLDADPAWSDELRDDSVYLSAFDANTFAIFGSDSDTEYRNVSDGKETAWSGPDTVMSVDGHLIAFDTNSDDTYDISGISSDGKKQWTIKKVESRLVVDGVLFVAKDDGDDVTPVDLGSGEERWKKPIDSVIPVAVYGDRVLMQSVDDGDYERQLIWVSLSSGEESDADAPKVIDTGYPVSSEIIGQSMLYVRDYDGGELVGFATDQRKELWSYSLDDDETVRVIGNHLFVWNVSDRELSLLGLD